MTSVAGSIRLTPIRIGEAPDALLLGPLTVSPDFKNRGLGKALMRTAMEAAAAAGDRIVLLVGDAPYYSPFGFQQVPPGRITLPGPVDPARLLVALLNDGDMPEGAGMAGCMVEQAVAFETADGLRVWPESDLGRSFHRLARTRPLSVVIPAKARPVTSESAL